MNKKDNIEKLVLTALMTALIAVVTAVIPIPVPFSSGYIHLGDSMVFLAVIILGWKRGAIAAAFGSMFADLFLGYVHWAPWTFVIKGGMALILGLILYKSINNKRNFAISCVILAGFWIAFNVAVQAIIRLEHANNASTLIEGSGVSSASEFGEFLSQTQSILMAAALAIPLLLLVVALLVRRSKKLDMPLSQIIAMSGSGMFMVFGYYVAAGIMYGNFAVSAFSIPMNILQFVVGFVLATIVSTALSKTPIRNKMAFYDHMKRVQFAD